MSNPGAIDDRKADDDAQRERVQPAAPTGAAVDDEDPDHSPMDRSPARNKDQARDRSEQDREHSPTDEIDGSGPNEDTYD